MPRIALVALVVLSTACGTRPAPDASRPGDLAPDDLSDEERAAFVYAAAIRHLVEELPEAPRRIYVLDRATGGAGGAAVAIPQSVQDRVREELAQLGSIRFVGDAGVARGDPRSVVIALGPVPPNPDRVELRVKIDARGTEKRPTLVLERDDLRWRVTETRGGGA